jgi:hypothetical protein
MSRRYNSLKGEKIGAQAYHSMLALEWDCKRICTSKHESAQMMDTEKKRKEKKRGKGEEEKYARKP